MLTELFIRYFFGDQRKDDQHNDDQRKDDRHKNAMFPPSENRLDFLNTLVWLCIAAISVWLLVKIL
ncbi:MAG: hypothetical protein MUF71_07925 [Candidatus Kapabacteria bacterium]|jgi:hypothetical protein|nr:hypothetical protein [Candidatus Kapabacteria bacterium]